MNHAVWILPATAATLFVACSYPDFQFRDEASTSGGGGGGSATVTASATTSGGGDPSTTTGSPATSTSTATSTTTSAGQTSTSTSSGPAPVVPCKDPTENCAPGQVCCFHQTDPGLDECGEAGQCGGSFYEYACNSSADCPVGQECCGASQIGIYTSIQCKPSCLAAEDEMCASTSDCSSGTCYVVNSYPEYGYCGI